MIEYKVLLSKELWDSSKNKDELKQKISDYMNRGYPDYQVLKIGKYYAICNRSGIHE